MIANLRGTSGSGKTTLARALLNTGTDAQFHYYPDKPSKIEATTIRYKGERIHVIGSYATNCGGCDTVPSQALVCELIDYYSLDDHVFFEGLMISHIYGRYQERALANPEEWVFLMLDTPFEICIENIAKRRAESGKRGELAESVYRNARRTYDSTYRIRDKLTHDNLQWENIPWGEDREKVFFQTLDFYLGV